MEKSVNNINVTLSTKISDRNQLSENSHRDAYICTLKSNRYLNAEYIAKPFHSAALLRLNAGHFF
jgi:hypothetical protein